MQQRISENPTRAICFSLGWLLGGIGTYFLLMGARRDLILKMLDDVNLRTDLINWIVTVGVYLPEEEFTQQFQEKATFINIVY